jgi:hypothetical protein
MGLKNVIKKKDPPKNETDFLDIIDLQKTKREEKEKLKYLEKLETQVMNMKLKKKNNINNTTIINNNINTIEGGVFISHKRLIDNLPKENNNNYNYNKLLSTNDKNLFDKKLLDDPEFRKTNIKKEKIEINCDIDDINKEKNKDKDINNYNNNSYNEDDIIDIEYMRNLSKEKLSFFLFKANQIYNFLSSIKLVRYIEIFIEDGFEDLESILGKKYLFLILNIFINI